MKIEDIATASPGYPFRGKLVEAIGSPVIAVQMKDVDQNTGIGWSSCLQVDLPGKKTPDWLAVGDILFVVRGNTNHSVLVDELPGNGVQAVASPYFYVLRAKRSVVLPEYLVWWLNQQACQRYFEMNAEGSFTKNVRRAVLESAPMMLPSLGKQKTIAKLSASLKHQRQVLTQQAENTRKLETAIARDMCAAAETTWAPIRERS